MYGYIKAYLELIHGNSPQRYAQSPPCSSKNTLFAYCHTYFFCPGVLQILDGAIDMNDALIVM